MNVLHLAKRPLFVSFYKFRSLLVLRRLISEGYKCDSDAWHLARFAHIRATAGVGTRVSVPADTPTKVKGIAVAAAKMDGSDLNIRWRVKTF